MTLTLPDHYRFGSPVRDLATQRWVEQGWVPELPPTRDELLTYAQKQLAAITATDAPSRVFGWTPVNSALASFAMLLLNNVVNGDDLATPQVAPTQDGGLDIQWLVSGDSLEIAIDPDEGVSIVVRYDNGECMFDFDWGWDDDIRHLFAATQSAGVFLGKISTGIQHRIPIR